MYQLINIDNSPYSSKVFQLFATHALHRFLPFVYLNVFAILLVVHTQFVFGSLILKCRSVDHNKQLFSDIPIKNLKTSDQMN